MTKTKVVTRRDMAEFVACLCNGLNPPPIGSIVPSFEVVALHSTDVDTEGKAVKLYDLMSGRTGCQISGGKITYAD